jgi:hypothetical protein
VIYVFGFQTFSSKEKVRKHAAAIRDKYPDDSPITNQADVEFLMDLIARHVTAGNKIGVGIKHFFVDTAPLGFGKCFWIERIDGTRTDFGVPSCLEDIGRINRRSLRFAIREHVQQFTRDNLSGDTFVSAYSGKTFPRDEAHVDHVTPFETIVTTFFTSKNIDVDGCLLTRSVDSNEEPAWEDPGLIAEFVEYHNTHALRIVHCRENLSEIKKAAI